MKIPTDWLWDIECSVKLSIDLLYTFKAPTIVVGQKECFKTNYSTTILYIFYFKFILLAQ